jgi:hypothetical protein
MKDVETIAELRARDHHAMLTKTAQELLWDWRAAAEIMRQTWEKAEANFDRFDPANGPLVSWVWNKIRLRLTIDYRGANGLRAPTSPDSEPHFTWTEKDAVLMRQNNPELLKHWEQGAEIDRASRLEYVELSERIETLPVVLRAPMRLWLDREEIPESLGWYVRQGLTLLGRRRAAA